VAHMVEERKVNKVWVGKPEGKRPLGRQRRRWELRSEWILGRLAWWEGGGLHSTGSGQGSVAGCGEGGYEPSGSCTTGN
jgi:hypothetical protein